MILKMYNEDEILLGRRAKDETEDFINQHFENPDKGWPKVRLSTCSSFDEFKKRKLEKNSSSSAFSIHVF